MHRSERTRAAPACALAAALAGAAIIAGTLSAPIQARAEVPAIELRHPPADEAADREKLFAALAAAQNATAAQAIAAEIWALWFRAPNEEAGKKMQAALEHSSDRDYRGSASILDDLVHLAPEWAEAWNQRATMRYLLHDFEGSLDDIAKVLALEPKHFGALSGQALILLHQGKMAAGQLVLRKAIEIDPFLSERALLMDGGGQDI